MMILVSYDVSTTTAAGRRRLRRVAKVCEDYGQRVQGSVFECLVDPTKLTELRFRLLAEIEETEDSLRFYHLGASWRGKVEHVGTKPVPDPEGPLIV